MLEKTLKRNKGITLIALVVTIIVLLILAGITIAMLTGQNGILNRATEARDATGTAQIDEQVKLAVAEALSNGLGTITDENLRKALDANVGAGNYELTGDATNGWTIKAGDKTYKISGNGDISGGDNTGGNTGTNPGGGTTGGETGKLPTGEGTTPYLPNSTFSKKEGDLTTGLVIQDANQNEYVWVEVPTTIYDNTTYNNNGANKPSSADDWEKIRDCLKAYTVDYSYSSYKDTNTDGTTYSDDYKNMLKSVYTNGGFWIGRYEAGLEGDTPRTSYTEILPSDKAVVKQNKIPYNYVKRDEAQELATRMNYNECTSSLIFGIQWDLVLKYIETKNATTKSNLISDSDTIGNYYNSAFTLNRGKFAQYSALSKWYNFNSEENPTLVTGSKKEKQSSFKNGILLTTGATEATRLQNIYDIAGNVREWTREFYNTRNPCVYRSGSYSDHGSDATAEYRIYDSTSDSFDYVGFRLGLWK